MVAIVGCRRSRHAAATDAFPDADWPLLREALGDAGVDAVQVPWDASGVEWGAFDAVVVRSTWDSVERPDEYLAWARHTARVTELLNPLPAIEWNIDKTYLRRLEARGVPIVPTLWLSAPAVWTPPGQEFVVKPSISGGGRQTARYRADELPLAAAHAEALLAAGMTVMIQPYVAGVETAGELKLVFVGGRLTHAVNVGPLLEPGTGVLERPWEKNVPAEPATPTQEQLQAARAVLAAVHAEVATPLLYGRVDLVPGADGESLLSEVELVDPSLFLRLAPPAARLLAKAISAVSQRGRRAVSRPS